MVQVLSQPVLKWDGCNFHEYVKMSNLQNCNLTNLLSLPVPEVVNYYCHGRPWQSVTISPSKWCHFHYFVTRCNPYQIMISFFYIVSFDKLVHWGFSIWYRMMNLCENCSTNQKPGNVRNSTEHDQKLISPQLETVKVWGTQRPMNGQDHSYIPLQIHWQRTKRYRKLALRSWQMDTWK